MWRYAAGCVLLVALVASVEALPVEQDADDVLLIDEGKNAHEQLLANRVAVAKAKVAAAKAKLQGRPRALSTSSTSSGGSSSSVSLSAVGATGKSAATAMVNANKYHAKPTGTKYLNRPVAGKKGFRKERGSAAIRAANFELRHIETSVQRKYDAKALKANNALRLKMAALAAARAEANMATAVRRQAETRATHIVLKLNKLRSALRRAKGKHKAKLQIALAKANADKKTIFAHAMKAGQAATAAIGKAARIEGTAVGLNRLKQDGPNELIAAVAAHNKAVANLRLFEANQRIKNGYEAGDAKRKAYFNKLMADQRKRMAAAMASYDKANNRDRSATFAAAATAPVKAHVTHVSAPKTRAAASAAANAAVKLAHKTGKASDAKAARKAIAAVATAKPAKKTHKEE